MALLLTEADVTALLPMSLALDAVEAGFRWQGEARLTNRPRVRLPVPGGLLHVMPAALPEAGVMGLKAYATVRGTAKFVVLLFSAESGALVAVIEADRHRVAGTLAARGGVRGTAGPGGARVRPGHRAARALRGRDGAGARPARHGRGASGVGR